MIFAEYMLVLNTLSLLYTIYVFRLFSKSAQAHNGINDIFKCFIYHIIYIHRMCLQVLEYFKPLHTEL